MEPKKSRIHSLFKLILLASMVWNLEACDFWKSLTESRYKKAQKGPSEKDLVNWKEKLALDEAEMEELEKRLRGLVQKSNQAGALSWKIARAYMRAGSSDQAVRYYEDSIRETTNTKDKGYEIHSYELALPYFEKAIELGKLDKQLLYETAVAYANASKDMGWEEKRRARAIQLFKQLIRLDKNDTRFPFQLALLYFDSSLKDEAWKGKVSSGFGELEIAFSLLDQILAVEPYNIPARFAKANFSYQIGSIEIARSEYSRIKSILEEMKEKGSIREPLSENQSYQNVLKNLKQLGSQ
ncbi:MAG: hypothetical protein O9301_11390 [Leptospira sp.]|nr:hypothetical protein [Leptospira sp.]